MEDTGNVCASKLFTLAESPVAENPTTNLPCFQAWFLIYIFNVVSFWGLTLLQLTMRAASSILPSPNCAGRSAGGSSGFGVPTKALLFPLRSSLSTPAFMERASCKKEFDHHSPLQVYCSSLLAPSIMDIVLNGRSHVGKTYLGREGTSQQGVSSCIPSCLVSD